ncbi:MAG: ABC transporter substrate-binding protein [Candidatus Tectomicrobia bacterium]|nr:ABC transporter substrate-binding protein [Candidatus Tectomicrobia bacterium]
MMWKRFLTVAFLGCLVAGAISESSAAEKVKFALDWVIAGRHAGYYVALEQGFWKEKGLDVEISRGFGSIDTVKRVISKVTDVGFADAATMILARSNGAKLKMLSVFYSKAPFVVISWADSNIRTPKDLEGKTIGEAAASAGRTVFPVLAKINGVDLSKIKWQNVEPASKNPSLIARKVDAILQYGFEKRYFDELTKQGKGNYRGWYYADFGLQMYGPGLISRDAVLSARPDVVRAFTEGAARGYAFVLARPQEAAAIFSKYQPLIARASILQDFDVLKELVMTPEAVANGPGWMTEEKIKKTRDIICETTGCKEVPAVSDIYTNEFLPRKK